MHDFSQSEFMGYLCEQQRETVSILALSGDVDVLVMCVQKHKYILFIYIILSLIRGPFIIQQHLNPINFLLKAINRIQTFPPLLSDQVVFANETMGSKRW